MRLLLSTVVAALFCAGAAPPQPAPAPLLPPDLQVGSVHQYFRPNSTAYTLRIGINNTSGDYRGPLELGFLIPRSPPRQPFWKVVSVGDVHVRRGAAKIVHVDPADFPAIGCQLPLIVTVDPGNRIHELNEGNNRLGAQLMRRLRASTHDLAQTASAVLVSGPSATTLARGAAYTFSRGQVVLRLKFRSCALFQGSFYINVMHGQSYRVVRAPLTMPGGGEVTLPRQFWMGPTQGEFRPLRVYASDWSAPEHMHKVFEARVKVR